MKCTDNGTTLGNDQDRDLSIVHHSKRLTGEVVWTNGNRRTRHEILHRALETAPPDCSATQVAVGKDSDKLIDPLDHDHAAESAGAHR